MTDVVEYYFKVSIPEHADAGISGSKVDAKAGAAINSRKCCVSFVRFKPNPFNVSGRFCKIALHMCRK